MSRRTLCFSLNTREPLKSLPNVLSDLNPVVLAERIGGDTKSITVADARETAASQLPAGSGLLPDALPSVPLAVFE